MEVTDVKCNVSILKNGLGLSAGHCFGSIQIDPSDKEFKFDPFYLIKQKVDEHFATLQKDILPKQVKKIEICLPKEKKKPKEEEKKDDDDDNCTQIKKVYLFDGYVNAMLDEFKENVKSEDKNDYIEYASATYIRKLGAKLDPKLEKIVNDVIDKWNKQTIIEPPSEPSEQSVKEKKKKEKSEPSEQSVEEKKKKEKSKTKKSKTKKSPAKPKSHAIYNAIESNRFGYGYDIAILEIDEEWVKKHIKSSGVQWKLPLENEYLSDLDIEQIRYPHFVQGSQLIKPYQSIIIDSLISYAWQKKQPDALKSELDFFHWTWGLRWNLDEYNKCMKERNKNIRVSVPHKTIAIPHAVKRIPGTSGGPMMTKIDGKEYLVGVFTNLILEQGNGAQISTMINHNIHDAIIAIKEGKEKIKRHNKKSTKNGYKLYEYTLDEEIQKINQAHLEYFNLFSPNHEESVYSDFDNEDNFDVMDTDGGYDRNYVQHEYEQHGYEQKATMMVITALTMIIMGFCCIVYLLFAALGLIWVKRAERAPKADDTIYPVEEHDGLV